MKRTFSLLTAVIILIALPFCEPEHKAGAYAIIPREPVAFQQTDPRWSDHVWKNVGDRTIGKSACGVFALINAVYYKTGIFLEPESTADWANASGFGTTSGIGAGIGSGQFYERAAANYGFSYECSTSAASAMLSYVRRGYAACACVPGHWIAVVDYDESSDTYLLLDSAVSYDMSTNPGKRTRHMCTSPYTHPLFDGNGDWSGAAWVKGELFELSPVVGNYGLNGRPIAILSISDIKWTCTDTSVRGIYTVNSPDGAADVHKYERSGSPVIGQIPDGTEVTVTKGTDGWYYVEEYGGHCNASMLVKKESAGRIYIVATQSTNLNIRTEPSTAGKIAGSAPKGAEMNVIAIVADGAWAMVEYNGITGYCSMQYLAEKEITAPEQPTPPSLSAVSGDRYSLTRFEWDTVSGASSYRLMVWNGIAGEDEPYAVLEDLTSASADIAMPDGYFEAYVEAVTDTAALRSNTVRMRIEEACILKAGDVNGDGKISAADAVALQKWLLGASRDLVCRQNADLYNDGRIDVYDLSLLRSMLISQ